MLLTGGISGVGSRSLLRAVFPPRESTELSDAHRLHVEAATSAGAGGSVALRAVLACVVEQGRRCTVTVPKGFNPGPLPTHVRCRESSMPAALIRELLGVVEPGTTTYLGMSDRLPLIRRAATNILVAQNPHLYGARTGLSTARQRLRLRILRLWAHRSLRHADWVVAATSATRDDVLGSAGPNPCHVVVRPIPPQNISARKTLHRPRVARLVMVGDVYEYKRFDEAIRAVDQWAAVTGKQAQVVHVGRAIEAAAHDALKEVVRASTHISVQLLGPLDHQRTVSELAGADLFLFPSSRESYGLPLAEALAIGVPAVCRDIPQFRELAGDAAEYFSGGAAEMARAIAATEPEVVRQRMSTLGRFRTVANIGWDVLRPPSEPGPERA